MTQPRALLSTQSAFSTSSINSLCQRRRVDTVAVSWWTFGPTKNELQYCSESDKVRALEQS